MFSLPLPLGVKTVILKGVNHSVQFDDHSVWIHGHNWEEWNRNPDSIMPYLCLFLLKKSGTYQDFTPNLSTFNWSS